MAINYVSTTLSPAQRQALAAQMNPRLRQQGQAASPPPMMMQRGAQQAVPGPRSSSPYGGGKSDDLARSLVNRFLDRRPYNPNSTAGRPAGDFLDRRPWNPSSVEGRDPSEFIDQLRITPGNKQSFIEGLLPGALEASRRTGIDPRIIIAQSAQETGWGRHAPGNMYWGVKSHGAPGGKTYNTHEYVDGKRVATQDSFRQYNSPYDAAMGYADFMLTNPRYKPFMQAQGLDAQLQALGASKYATDPNYARSVGAIARSMTLPTGAGGVQVASADPGGLQMMDTLPGGMQPPPQEPSYPGGLQLADQLPAGNPGGEPNMAVDPVRTASTTAPSAPPRMPPIASSRFGGMGSLSDPQIARLDMKRRFPGANVGRAQGMFAGGGILANLFRSL